MPRPRQGRPVESVELRISIRADRETTNRIKEEIPSAVIRGGGCEVMIVAEQPGEMAERAKTILDKLRAIEGLRKVRLPEA